MNSEQYEELCRRYVAEAFGVPLTAVRTGRLPNPHRPGLPEYEHAIDLFWETGTEAARYFHIGNAKWRASEKVDQPEILLLQKVREEVAAHKAVMLTPIGFTQGALAAAQHHGIALHVVRPAESVVRALPSRGRKAMREKLETLSSSGSRPIHTAEVIHRAWTPQRPQPAVPMAIPCPSPPPAYQTRVLTGYQTRTVTLPTGPTASPIQKRDGSAFGFSKK